MRAAFLIFCLMLSGCAELGVPSCPEGTVRATAAELFFGRNIGSAEGIGDADWRGFVDAEVAPRFPGGFTISDAEGAWRGADGRMTRERSKRLFIVLAGQPDEGARLDAIRAAYKTRFHQEGVMLFETRGCVGF